MKRTVTRVAKSSSMMGLLVEVLEGAKQLLLRRIYKL